MDEIAITFPPMVEGQIGWYVDSPHNRLIAGETFIARDWFPKLIVPDIEPASITTEKE